MYIHTYRVFSVSISREKKIRKKIPHRIPLGVCHEPFGSQIYIHSVHGLFDGRDAKLFDRLRVCLCVATIFLPSSRISIENRSRFHYYYYYYYFPPFLPLLYRSNRSQTREGCYIISPLCDAAKIVAQAHNYLVNIVYSVRDVYSIYNVPLQS